MVNLGGIIQAGLGWADNFSRRFRMHFRLVVLATFSLFLLMTNSLSVSAQEVAAKIRIGIIGLDTSHSIEFAKLINDINAKSPLAGCQVVCAYPHGSLDIESSVSRIPEYTNQIQAMGIEIVASADELISKVDAVLLETNDGRRHLEQVLPILKAGKPVFVDKPMAASLADVIAIFQAAEQLGTPVFSSSSLRFVDPAQLARQGKLVGNVFGCETYCPASLEPTHPDLYWYGIHGVEQLFTVMGPGCESVSRVSTAGTDVVVGVWSDGRMGTFRGTRTGPHHYGGTVFGAEGQKSSGGNEGYEALLGEVVSFFRSGKPPVDAAETIEIYAFMSAADESKNNSGMPVRLKDVVESARLEATSTLSSQGFAPHRAIK